MKQYGLGLKRAYDKRDELYRLTSITKISTSLPENKFWQTGPVLDQGNTPQCVGFSWKGWLACRPLRTMNGPSASQIYQEAKRIDEWEGEDYDGTSVRAGVKYLQKIGRVANYYWAYDVEEMKKHILLNGPLVMATDWKEAMFEPNKEGWIFPKGESAGGHAWLIVGFSTKKNAFRGLNSWGKDWSTDGRFWIGYDDLHNLIKHSWGEACAATEKKP